MAPRPSSSFQPSLAFPCASSDQPASTSVHPSHPRESHHAVHDGQAQTPAPVPDATSSSGSAGTPGHFVRRLLAERRSHGHGLPAFSSAARLAPSVPPLQTSLFSSPVSADSGEDASGAHAVKAPPAPDTVLGLDRAPYATGLERLRPAGHRAMETQETTMEVSPLASGQKGKARDI
jgi:hypothetical protein